MGRLGKLAADWSAGTPWAGLSGAPGALARTVTNPIPGVSTLGELGARGVDWALGADSQPQSLAPWGLRRTPAGRALPQEELPALRPPEPFVPEPWVWDPPDMSGLGENEVSTAKAITEVLKLQDADLSDDFPQFASTLGQISTVLTDSQRDWISAALSSRLGSMQPEYRDLVTESMRQEPGIANSLAGALGGEAVADIGRALNPVSAEDQVQTQVAEAGRQREQALARQAAMRDEQAKRDAAWQKRREEQIAGRGQPREDAVAGPTEVEDVAAGSAEEQEEAKKEQRGGAEQDAAAVAQTSYPEGVTHRDRWGNYYKQDGKTGRISRYAVDPRTGEPQWYGMGNLSPAASSERQAHKQQELARLKRREQQSMSRHSESDMRPFADPMEAARSRIGFRGINEPTARERYFQSRGVQGQDARREARMNDPRYVANLVRSYDAVGQPLPDHLQQRISRMEQQTPDYRDRMEAHMIADEGMRRTKNPQQFNRTQAYGSALKGVQQNRAAPKPIGGAGKKTRTDAAGNTQMESNNADLGSLMAKQAAHNMRLGQGFGSTGLRIGERVRNPFGGMVGTPSALKRGYRGRGLSGAADGRSAKNRVRNRYSNPAVKSVRGATPEEMVKNYLRNYSSGPGPVAGGGYGHASELRGSGSAGRGSLRPPYERPAQRQNRPGALGSFGIKMLNPEQDYWASHKKPGRRRL